MVLKIDSHAVHGVVSVIEFQKGVLTSLFFRLERGNYWLKPELKDVKTLFNFFCEYVHAVNGVAISTTELGNYRELISGKTSR